MQAPERPLESNATQGGNHIDATAVHMAYIQLALLYVPAVVVQGDTLRMTELDTWYTPAHIYDGWKWKLRNRSATLTTGEAHAMVATQ